LIFVDADTLATPEAVRGALAAVGNGAVGGGCLFRFDGRLPFWARIMYPIGIRMFRALNVVGGCFLFCTRDAFDSIGGFSVDHFAAEELVFAKALKCTGRFVIPPAYVVTSGRKLRTYSGFEVLWTLLRLVWHGQKSYRTREGLEVWYGERRADPESCRPS